MVDESFSLKSEFATVRLSVRRSLDAEGLLIQNTETDEVIYLDPLELEALTRMRHKDFGPLILT